MFRKLKKNLVRFYAGALTILAPLYRLVFNITEKAPQGEPLKRVVLLVSRPQDVDLLISLNENARLRNNLSLFFWVTKNCARNYPETLSKLEGEKAVVEQVVNFIHLGGILNKLMRIDAFLSTVESTTAKNKLPYIITKLANAASVQTYTLQHGFENVGLSYYDEVHGPNTKFAARTVLTWGPTNELPSWVAKETRVKSIAVGCPNILLAPQNDPTVNIGENPIIAVFDNLHWTRFDQRYITTFLEHLEKISEDQTGYRFILKSHPASIRNRSIDLKHRLFAMKRVVVADMSNEEHATMTTPSLMSRALGVITTPSTIALDGALAGVPVAIASYGLNLDYYSPLNLLNNLEDWHNFLDSLTDNSAYRLLKLNGEQFLQRVIVPGDPAEKILDLMTGR